MKYIYIYIYIYIYRPVIDFQYDHVSFNLDN